MFHFTNRFLLAAICGFVILATSTLATNAAAAEVQVDADFPGGNIQVSRIEGDQVYLQQDLRDTQGWWFYYAFRVRGAGGKSLTFHWENKNPTAALGPACSSDGGKTWQWLGKDHAGEAFSYTFGDAEDEVLFALAPLYQLANLEAFMEKHKENSAFAASVHARSRKDRPVYRFQVGNRKDPKYRVFLSARHHSCEMMASYVLEGILEEMLADTEHGKWLRENVEILAVPMMDVDGVEDGDQGKNRKPHDHNRDYLDEPLYPAVAANMKTVPVWSQGKLVLGMDLHCPYVRGGRNDQIFFVGKPGENIWKNTETYAAMLESINASPLPYRTKNNLPWGEEWNSDARGLANSCGHWLTRQEGIKLATTLEFPYAVSDGKPILPDTARSFGGDMARTMKRFLQSLED